MAQHSPLLMDVNGTSIAYHHSKGQGDIGVMFLGGFMSDMQGSKATMLERFCQDSNLDYTRMDYGGHGQSGGTFQEGTIGLWKTQVLAVFDEISKDKQKMVLTGSSMGGWMMLLIALARPQKVAGLVGIASAPDFTEKLMWSAFSEEQKQEMEQNGCVMLKNCMPGEDDYPITWQLIAEGRNHLLLDDTIDITCPVHLIHGQQDPDVPWQLAHELADKLASEQVKISLVEKGDHRMSTPEDLELIRNAVQRMVAEVSQSISETAE